jgi:uncharacterized protein with gpF-like domain
MNINEPATVKAQLLHDEKPLTTEDTETDSSESESDSAESESSEEEKKPSISKDENKVTAPVEMKAEFLKCVMNEEYENAKEICQKSKRIIIILLNIKCNL